MTSYRYSRIALFCKAFGVILPRTYYRESAHFAASLDVTELIELLTAAWRRLMSSGRDGSHCGQMMRFSGTSSRTRSLRPKSSR
jgi:hypothetical protein